MWKSVVGHNVSAKVASEGDDWETDPDFEVYSNIMSCYPQGNHLIFYISTTSTFILNSGDDQYKQHNLCRFRLFFYINKAVEGFR